MRPKYYIKLFGQMNSKKSFVLFAILVISIIISSIYFLKNLAPTIKVACETRARAIGLQVTEETVREFIENIEYESLMNMTYNESRKNHCNKCKYN